MQTFEAAVLEGTVQTGEETIPASEHLKKTQ